VFISQHLDEPAQEDDVKQGTRASSGSVMEVTLRAADERQHSRNLVFPLARGAILNDKVRTPVGQPGVDRIAALVPQPTDLVSLWHAATGVIAKFVPHADGRCWYTVDPASLLITSHVQEGLAEFPPNGWRASTTTTTSTRSATSCARQQASARCTRLPAG
jgi:hypothetical protein